MMKIAPWVFHFHGRLAMTSDAVGVEVEEAAVTSTHYNV